VVEPLSCPCSEFSHIFFPLAPCSRILILDSHWASWLSLVPDRPGLSTIELFSRAASILGGPNFLRRFLFDSGSVEITLGYAVTLYRYALKEEDLGAAEHTWEAHDPYLPVRRKLEEGTEKLTYYICTFSSFISSSNLG